MIAILKEKNIKKGLFIEKTGKDKKPHSSATLEKIQKLLDTDSCITKDKVYLFQINKFFDKTEMIELVQYYKIIEQK